MGKGHVSEAVMEAPENLTAARKRREKNTTTQKAGSNPQGPMGVEKSKLWDFWKISPGPREEAAPWP